MYQKLQNLSLDFNGNLILKALHFIVTSSLDSSLDVLMRSRDYGS